MDSLSNTNERERLLVLQSPRLLDSGHHEGFDRITRIASALFRVPVVLLSLIDSDRQWFMSTVGVDTPQTCR